MTGKIGIGIIGYGARISGVLGSLRKATERIDVVAVHDPNPDAIRNLQKYYPQAIVFDDYQALTRDPRVQWVFIGSWNCFHAQQAIAAMEAGKHIFCEKPLATTFEDGLAMQKTLRQSGVMFAVGFTLRYSPHYRKIRGMIESGALGKIVSLEANETLGLWHGGMITVNWRNKTEQSGGHLLEKCCHDIDVMNWMVGSLPVRVASFGGRGMFVPANNHLYKPLIEDIADPSMLKDVYKGWRKQMLAVNPFTVEHDIVDNQVLILEYADGVRATFHTNLCAALPERRLYILGTEGAARMNLHNNVMEYCRTSILNRSVENETVNLLAESDNDILGHAGGDAVLGRELAASMLEGALPAAGLNDGLASAIVCFAAEQARRANQVVELAPYWNQAGITL